MEVQPERRGLAVFLSMALVLFLPLAALAASAPSAKPAKLQISGYGILGNRQLKRLLRTLELNGEKPELFTPGFVEDSAFLLSSHVRGDGYLRPTIHIELTLNDGTQRQLEADSLLENPLPRALKIKRARFVINSGRRYFYRELTFRGLETVTEKQARALFIVPGTLLPLKSDRVYTPERLRRSLASLTDILDRQGYRNASASASQLALDNTSGAVSAQITVEQGPKFMVRSVQEEFYSEDGHHPEQSKTVRPNLPYSHIWEDDFTVSLKTNQFKRGFPDVTVELTPWHMPQGALALLTSPSAPSALSNQPPTLMPSNGIIDVHLLASITNGPQVRIGAVKFEGAKRTRPWFMARRVRVQRGELLDRMRVEEGRYRLAQIGAFDTVDLDYKTVNENTRDVIYKMKEGKRTDLSLLAGYGTYEMLRGGAEVVQNDLWGLGHRARLKGVQSFKSTSGDFTYTVPDFTGSDVDAFANAAGLRRQEVSFTREDYGGGVGLHKFFKDQAADVTVRYNYQIFNSLNTRVTQVATEGVTNPTVGEVVLEVRQDRRDNPLYPRKGYNVFFNIQLAGDYLGGNVNYTRLETFNSWHHPLGPGHWISLGLRHGVAVSFGDPAQNLPFDQRFFPGGANSIRGYNDDEASPRNSLGQIVGAETYVLGTVELEQAITRSWSIVAFSDSLGEAEHINHYPFDTCLYSVGGGIRWRTIIGPLRLEYGKNLNPRPKDPSGTLQISLGYPF